MSDSSGKLRQKLAVAADLRGVVRTMKALAASSIGTYEQAVRALADYDRTVKLGLSVTLRQVHWDPAAATRGRPGQGLAGAIVFGSDQGLVGQFNDVIADFCIETLSKLPGRAVVWVVGERVRARLADAGLVVKEVFPVPTDVGGIAELVGRLQVQTARPSEDGAPFLVFHNRQSTASEYEPTSRQLLPLDGLWRNAMIAYPWPDKYQPEWLDDLEGTLRALVREYLFISLFQACAESLASENASRLASMQRAEKSIDDITEETTRLFHRTRQATIDEELFDVLSGFEALK